jgi:isoleucyl-tRNA synthetase
MGYCTTQLKPNLKTLGKKHGAKLKEIQQALPKMDLAFDQISKLQNGGTIKVADVELGKDDLLISMLPEPGKAVASEGNLTVALETELTPELIAEGHAREVISVLQQARKDAGLEVSDRITVFWETADAELAAALTAQTAFISEEVLATSFAAGTGSLDAVINGKALRYALSKETAKA